MAGACLGCNLESLKDQTVPLRSVVGSEARDFASCVSRYRCVEEKMAAIESRLTCLPPVNKVQKAIRELVGRKGQLSLDDFAALAAVGPRQLRRTCRKQSGLAPKHLARILRFRHAAARLRIGEHDMAGLAQSCGYYDQAHLIRDFQHLAGMSPGSYSRQHRE
jgi:AraC-like DNA-binding protein